MVTVGITVGSGSMGTVRLVAEGERGLSRMLPPADGLFTGTDNDVVVWSLLMYSKRRCRNGVGSVGRESFLKSLGMNFEIEF